MLSCTFFSAIELALKDAVIITFHDTDSETTRDNDTEQVGLRERER